MIKVLLTLTLLILAYSSATSQEKISIEGEWIISDIKIIGLDPENDIDETNCYWADVKSIKKPVVFKQDGTVNFFKIVDSEVPTEINIRYEISGKELKLIYTGTTESKLSGENDSKMAISESYTSYEFSINNSRLVLKNQDPMVSESYTFIKK
jgi:hypothetical protein